MSRRAAPGRGTRLQSFVSKNVMAEIRSSASVGALALRVFLVPPTPSTDDVGGGSGGGYTSTGTTAVIVPSTIDPGVSRRFRVMVFSETPLLFSALPSNKRGLLQSAWTRGSAGGSHINGSSWMCNPQFQLVLGGSEGGGSGGGGVGFGGQPNGGVARVQILLSRLRAPPHQTAGGADDGAGGFTGSGSLQQGNVPPGLPSGAAVSSQWRNQIAADSLGCMIGFYVFAWHERGPVPLNASLRHHQGQHDSYLVHETAFVTEHSVSVTLELPFFKDGGGGGGGGGG